MNFEIHPEEGLLDPPTKRAAYSDRTAWLMSVCSLLAYVPFEAPPSDGQLRLIAETIAGENDVEAILDHLKGLKAPGKGTKGRTQLKKALEVLQLELVKTYSVPIGLKTDTQAYIAKVSQAGLDAGRPNMIILAFRGTEPKKLADLRTDADALLHELPHGTDLPDGKARVHAGFLEAYESIADQVDAEIKKHDNVPVFVTGHSLGGALAVVATRFIANGSRGACYTFGGPRAGNYAFVRQIFTPVYRVVNAADIVPAVPLGGAPMRGLIMLSKLLPPPLNHLTTLLERMRDYRHAGDVRFLTFAHPVSDGDRVAYPKMRVFSNPSLYDRWVRSAARLIATWGGAALGDHSIETYVAKLAYHARTRSDMRKALNSDHPMPKFAKKQDAQD